MGLAWGLMRDFVPAFGKEKPNVGTPKQKHTKVDGAFPHAHEARLVQIVGALRRILTDRERPSTNTAAYNQLLKILKVSPAPLWRYGKHRKVSALQQAWKDIPKDVRNRPDSYFPLHLPQWDFPKGASSRSGSCWKRAIHPRDATHGRVFQARVHGAPFRNPAASALGVAEVAESSAVPLPIFRR